MTDLAAMGASDGRLRADACAHSAKEYLGRDGSAAFYRCRDCGAVLIEDRGRLWWLRPAPAAA